MTLLAESFSKKDFESAIDNSKSKATVYKQLKEALELIEEFSDSDFSTISFTEKIVANDTNPKIISIKKDYCFGMI